MCYPSAQKRDRGFRQTFGQPADWARESAGCAAQRIRGSWSAWDWSTRGSSGGGRRSRGRDLRKWRGGGTRERRGRRSLSADWDVAGMDGEGRKDRGQKSEMDEAHIAGEGIGWLYDLDSCPCRL